MVGSPQIVKRFLEQARKTRKGRLPETMFELTEPGCRPSISAINAINGPVCHYSKGNSKVTPRSGVIPTTTNITVVGAPGVGKTALVRRFLYDTFSSTHTPTSGVHTSQAVYRHQSRKVGDRTVIFRFIDTSDNFGVEPSRSMTLEEWMFGVYAHLSCFVIVVYDISCHKSFDIAQEWVRLAKEHMQSDVTMILVGNKTDLGRHREVHSTAGEVFALLNDLHFMETSTKDTSNLQRLFRLLNHQEFFLTNHLASDQRKTVNPHQH